ncbi:O-antigen ligase family protein [Morganella morganii]|nr:O-antigen ligase family protein [Morganella morganii]
MERLFFFVVSLYIIFIPLGNALVFINNNTKLDIIIALSLFILVTIDFLYKNIVIKKINLFYIYLLLILCSSILISSLVSFDIIKSTFGGAITLGYAWVTGTCALFLVKEKTQSLYTILYYSLILSFFIQIYSISGFIDNPWQRATIPVIMLQDFSWHIPPGDVKTDPNVLAFGVVLSYFYLNTAKITILRRLVSLIIVISTLLMTESRSAFIGFIISVLFYLTHLYIIKNGIKKTFTFIICITTFLFIVSFIFYICSFHLNRIYAPNILSRLFSIGSDLSSNSRLQGINTAIDLIKNSSWFRIIFGHGVDQILHYTDPHNIFIATMYNQGLLGLVTLISFFILMCFFSSKSGDKKILSLTIVLFLFIISNLYWQTKILWVGFLFIMTLYYRNQYKCTHH